MEPPRLRKKDWELTPEALAKLLSSLHPDPALAEQEYESIRRRLIEFFRLRKCATPEEQADETLDRGARRLSEGAVIKGKPSSYFRGIAAKVLQEYYRKPALATPPPITDPAELELKHECMRQCLSRLDAATRELLTEYCQAGPQAKLRMAERLGVSRDTLKLRVHHLRRGRLGECLRRCMERAEAGRII